MNKTPITRPLLSMTSQRIRRSAIAAAILLSAQALNAGTLTIDDGVVIKFGADAQLVVRDQLVAGKDVTLTSQKDDSAGGPSASTPQSPASGDWRGLRIEKSAAAAAAGGPFTLNGWSVRYAGPAPGSSVPGAALTLRGGSPGLQFLSLSDSDVGLQLLDGAQPAITGASFLRNGTGLLASGSSGATVTGSQFVGNRNWGVNNQTPSVVLNARGNWWGHPSGAKDSVGNPQGQGDAVSTGVDHGAPLAAAPLLNPSLRLAYPSNYFAQRNVLFELACINATEYRIAEGGAFAGLAFQALNNERAQVELTLSAGDGLKAVSAQCRNAAGTLVTASLAGGVRIDTEAPQLAIANPGAGSVISQSVSIDASASDGGGIASVAFHIDGALKTTDTTAPYSFAWNIDSETDGEHSLRVVATDAVGRTSEQTRSVTLARVPLGPDTQGPDVSNVRLGAAALTNGAVIATSGNVSFSASDRSGIARAELLLDDAVITTASGTSSFSAALNIDAVANGAHTLALRVVDSLGNATLQSYSVTVAHAAPATPAISEPTNGTVTRAASITVTGTAPAGSSVQVFRGGQAQGALITIGSDGRFNTTVELLSGANLIQAQASNAHGSSALSSGVNVTRDTSVPGSPSNLSAVALSGGPVKLSWTRSSDVNAVGYQIYRSPNSFTLIGEATRVNASVVNANTYEDLPPNDGSWTYRVVAVNTAATPSEPTNAASATSDSTAPVAVSVAYSSTGKTDPASGAFGQGRIDLVLTTSEPLQTTPYLSIVPQGGSPITVNLSKTGETAYQGSFLISGNTPSGVADALFSARDAVGNRGTQVQSGATLRIDTQGPILSGIALTPAAPIRNEGSPTLGAVFTFSKAPAATPQVRYLLSGANRTAVDLALSATSATTYSASFTLPSDAGQGAPETLVFRHTAKDALDNVSSQVAAFNQFQVYQGELPPLDVPVGLTAKAQPGGKVRLSWQAVEGANSYQLYRRGPGQSVLEALARNAGTEYVDSTPADGSYLYAVATVRQVNGQESLSGQSAPVSVTTIANAPGAPQNLTLTLTGQGIYAAWQAPLASQVDHYRLYRASGSTINSIEGLSPIKSLIKLTQTYDSSPSPTQGAYVVTAVDAAGNESALSNSAYLNASLLPVRNLKAEQLGNALPLVSWSAPNGNVAGYKVYVGPDSAPVLLTPAPITATQFEDTGFTSGERRYSVATVDANGIELASSVLLPNVSGQIASGLPLLRGVMNRVQVQLTNTSAQTLGGVTALVRVPVNAQSTQFKDHRSAAISLAPNETRLVPVVVGGYAELPGAPQLLVGVEIAPEDGPHVMIARHQTVQVGEGALVVGMTTEAFTRGATGQVKLTIENTSEVDVELLTANANGAQPSSELRFKILDADGNVLATQPYQQALGANVVTLTNGQTVARIAAGSSYVSEVFELNVPSASPKSIRVKLEVDQLRYHSGQPDQILITGRGSEKTVPLGETAYLGEVSNVTPVSSFGDQDIVISGRAIERSSSAPMPNARLKLVLNQQGFERTFQVLTDGSGAFSHSFKPTVTDAGLFKVSAVHPDITDRPEQKSFTINRVTVSPALAKLNLPKNYPFTLPFKVSAGAGTSATHLRLTLDAVNQPTGQIPAGVEVTLAAPVNVVERQTLNIPAVFSATHEAQPTGALIFNVVADESPNAPLGVVRVDYTLSEATPYLVSTPSFVETGLAQGAAQVEPVAIKNSGLQEAINLQFSLSRPDGSAVPSWVSIASQANGTLAVGETRSIDLSFTPPASVAEGLYEFWLNIVGDNVPAQTVKVYASLSQSGQGNVLFKASDIYTATVGKDGQLIQGLPGASITLQNEEVPTIALEMVSDNLGEALFQNVPTGRYRFKAKANNHQEVSGRLQIKPGITLNQPVFLNNSLITVEWNVREIIIEDRYDITLSATFETDVPVAVVVMQPASVNLPKMAEGDVYFGELSLTNHGLLRADNLRQTLPRSDPYFRFEFLSPVPSSLGAKERVTLPYRVVALQSLEAAASGGEASGGGCYNYNNSTTVESECECANGALSKGATSTNWFAYSNSTCPAPTGGKPTPIPLIEAIRPHCSSWCGNSCCASGGNGGGGGVGALLPGGPRCVGIPRNGVEYNPGTCSAP